MKRYSIFVARPLVLASAFFLAPGFAYAQVTPGPGGSIVGQPPGQNNNIIGQPVPGQSSPPPYPPVSGSQSDSRIITGTDPVKDKLNRANREAADIDRDGRISPEEASRIPPGTPVIK
ncbi:hypothetical protein SAMN05720354_11030 [Nitrosospira sp. Nsp1]|nr:hypothetical protein SAMN05720354_11030 [Nitrosospira sp. Nsp1]